jgi:enamine deaminase RidA (YjgF/YER057c/UK114 family)
MPTLFAKPIAPPVPGLAKQTGKAVSVTVTPDGREGLEELCRRFTARLRNHGATPLHLLVFGNCAASGALHQTLNRMLGRVDWPITWVEGGDCRQRPVAGLQAHAFTGDVERVVFHGRFLASVFHDGGARQCIAGGLLPGTVNVARPDQTVQALELLQSVLAEAGFELTDVVRTWFFLENILSWYDDFNRTRTKFYSGLNFRTGSWPASTGVGARNPAGAALALAAWAFRPLEGSDGPEEVASPLQCPAPAYGSSFSRAMETSTNGGRRLFISGTASIAPGGKTLWVGDMDRQVDLTMNVVEAILHSRGYGFSDIARATAYFRRAVDLAAFVRWQTAHQLTDLPVVAAQCDVCRDDLLFELEAEAEAAD